MEDIKDIFEEAMKRSGFQEALQGLKMEKAQIEALSTVIIQLSVTVTESILKKRGLLKERKKPKRPVVCFRCQKEGHVAKACIERAVCKHCGKQHLTRDCPDTVCKQCGKKHPKDRCRKTDTYCRICRVWGLHKAENCPNRGLVGRLQRLERILPPNRAKSSKTFRRERSQRFPGRGRARARGRRGKPEPRPGTELMDQS